MAAFVGASFMCTTLPTAFASYFTFSAQRSIDERPTQRDIGNIRAVFGKRAVEYTTGHQ